MSLSNKPLMCSTTTAPKPKANSDLAKRWREIMGENDWDTLLDPLDPLLRVELIKYGEFSQCTHIAFESDLYSFKYGSCKFQIADFFDHELMPQEGYKATHLIYASSPINKWSWMFPKPVHFTDMKETDIFIGFIAVSDDQTTKNLGRRDVCISWRGTTTGIEWNDDFIDYLKDAKSVGWEFSDSKVRFEAGFLDLYAYKDDKKISARDCVLAQVKKLINDVYPTEDMSITVTGHSLGAALALINAFDVADSKANVRNDGTVVPVTAMTFGGPRVGNYELKKSIESLGVKVLRVVNVRDLVPKIPGVLVNETTLPDWLLKILDEHGFPWAFTHVGVKLEFDSEISQYLKPVDDKDMNFHNLNTYIHIVDGYHGKELPFKSETGWDYVLVNSDSENLKVECAVPPGWNIEKNKGMVQDSSGHWVHKSTLSPKAN